MTLPQKIKIPTKKKLLPGRYYRGKGCGCLAYHRHRLFSDSRKVYRCMKTAVAAAPKVSGRLITHTEIRANAVNIDIAQRTFRHFLTLMGYECGRVWATLK